jgi:tetratricopeptide (TPR) repeat protein
MIKKSWIVTGITLLLLIAIPANGRTYDWEKAVSLYKQGQFRLAIEEFQKVVKEVPDHADSWKFIGLAYFQLKEYQASIEPLEKAQELKRKEGRNDTDLVRALGQAYLSLKKYEQALPYFEIITRMQMNVAANFYMLGVIYANLNRPEEASKAFEKSVKLDPKDGDSWYYLGVQHFRNGRTNEAIMSLRNGVEASPRNVEMLSLLAEALLRQGAAETNENIANALFEEAIRVANNLKSVRDNAESAEILGRAYLAAKKYTNAELMLSRALEGSKQPDPALYFNLGYAHAQNKSWARAAEMLAQADKLKPADLNTLYYLGFVYENLRRYPQALDAYSRAYEASGRNNADLKASIDRVTPMIKQ